MEPEKDDDKSNNRSTPEPNTPPPVDPAKERTKLRTAEKDRIEAIRSLGGKYEGMEDMVLKAIEEGTEVGDFNRQVAEELGQRNTKLRSQETEEPDVDLTDKEMKKFSLIRLMGAIANPNDHAMQQRAGFELEVVAAAAAKLPSEFNVRGAFIPATLAYNSIGMSRAHEPIIRRDLTVGNDGDLVGTDHRGDRFIDVLRNNMVALQAGVVPLPGLVGNVDIPRQTAGASATWVSAEDGDATESEATFDTVQLQPKDLACYTEVTRRLVQQSIPAVEGIIRNDLAKAIGLGLDSAVYYGSGASGQPQGINGATGVDDPTIASATAPTYAELVTIIKTLMSSNAANNLTWIGSPDFWESMMTTPKQGSGVEGNFISNGTSIIGRPHLTSSQLTADDFVVGDFSQILMGEWGGYELNVDPYTHSLKGKIRFVVYKTVDLAIRHPEAFSFHDAA